jgi:hypothetical protein
MIARLILIGLASTCMGQFPRNADFSTTQVSHFTSWKNGAISSIVVKHDPVEGNNAPGSIHATVTGSGHAEAGIAFSLPTQVIGGKMLEFRGKAKLQNISEVAIVYWYQSEAGVSEQWQHIGIFAGSENQWISPTSPIIKQIEDANKFRHMKVAFYLFTNRPQTSTWDFWLDDIELIADDVNITGQATRIAPMTQHGPITISRTVQPRTIDLMGRCSVLPHNRITSGVQHIIYHSQVDGKTSGLHRLTAGTRDK